jgi:MYXO-CTERM domain-containing protein
MKRVLKFTQYATLFGVLAAGAFAQPTPSPAADQPSAAPSSAPPAGQASGTPGSPSTYSGSSRDYNNTDDGDHNFGWVGLLGLAGLTGLMRRDRRDTNARP